MEDERNLCHFQHHGAEDFEEWEAIEEAIERELITEAETHRQLGQGNG